MKIVRDFTFAITLGIIGGLAVTVLSYYNDHKEGGIRNTLMAVADSANLISDAYSDTNERGYKWNIDKDMLAGGRVTSDTGEYIDRKVPAFSDGVTAAWSEDGCDGDNAGDCIYSDIIRFHVRANSDSEEDQELKLAVRDDVMTMLKPLLKDCKSESESKAVVLDNLQNIYTTAINTITEQGYDYPVKVYMTVEEFPAKVYGDLTFPEGKYQALRIDIGEALGQNWWCVMYPPLCFIDDATVVVSKEGKRILEENLTQEEYRALFADSDADIKAESFICKKIKGWFENGRNDEK